MPLMKENSILSYSHGFNIVEEGVKIRKDITVIMVAPKCPGTEVREEYLRGFGVPTLIAVHPENDPNGEGLEFAKAYAVSTGGHKAGVLESSFVAEVKSDLMGEQTILCGVLQTGSILCFNKMIELGYDSGFSSKLIQYGWETITEELKHNGITEELEKIGYKPVTGVAKTGVVAILNAGKPGPVVGLRADIDGLPVKERANIPWASKMKGIYNGEEVPVMHACGHDTVSYTHLTLPTKA